ncbi:peptide chain release factor N(5)-glutamine methyltransferase [Patescibacteria group bacterium]|nr:peptide chain release factor N(5)-glutamine methyltransferase [Patescibacteria group bacterium]
MNNELQTLFKIQEALKTSGYYDISRVAKDILEYTQNNPLPLDIIIERIKNNEPWEYIKEQGEFKGNIFKLNTHTLIPRIETEIMIDIVKQELLKSPTPYTDIIDVGTGSGCIIISLVKELERTPEEKVNIQKYSYHATDISQEAIDIAKENEKNILNEPVIHFSQTDLIESIALPKNSFCMILANLPYIPTQQYLALEKSVVDFEPRTALDGGENGITYYEKLLEQIEVKNIKGCAIFEIEPSTLELFKPLYPKVIKDQYGKDRFILIRFS